MAYTRSGRNWLNQSRFSFTRLRVFDVPQSAFGANIAAELGVTGVSSDPFTYGLPYFLVGNYATLTDDPTIPKVQRDNSWNYSDGLSLIRGRHTFKAGFQGIRFQLNYLRDQNQRGQFSYTGRVYPRDLNNPNATGDAFADFLLGYPQNTLRNIGDTQAYLRQTTLGAYFQDDWRISPRLTLNLGLRYEYTSPWSATRNNLLNVDFSHLPAAPTLIRQSTATNPDRNNFAPRAGLAWRLPGRFFERGAATFRAGYGIYYSPEIAIEVYDLVLNGIRSEQNQADGIMPVLTTANGFPQTSTSGFSRVLWNQSQYQNAVCTAVARWISGRASRKACTRSRLRRHQGQSLRPVHSGQHGTAYGKRRESCRRARVTCNRCGSFRHSGRLCCVSIRTNSIYHALQVKVEKRLPIV